MDRISTLRSDSRLFGRSDCQQARTVPDARRHVSGALSPHRLAVIGDGGVDVLFRRASAGTLPVLLLRYGADVAIDPEPLSGHVLLQIVVSGRAELTNARERIVALPGDAMIVESLAGCSLRWSADCEKIIIPIAHAALRDAIELVTGRSIAEPFGFRHHFQLDGPEESGTLDLVRYILSQAGSPRSTAILGSSVQDLLARHLVVHHSEREWRYASIASGPVRRAVAYMLANLEEEFDLDMLAASARCSARRLCEAFQRYQGRSPLATLRDMRLDAVRALLSGAHPPSVTEAALQYRLYHVGRFAAAYKARFGELPSETLRTNAAVC